MPRKKLIGRRELAPDAAYNSVLVARFVNALMGKGKKSTAEGIFHQAMKIIEKKTGQDGLSLTKTALSNVKPVLEVKSRRVGGATYQVPVEVRPERRTALGIRWLITFASQRPDHTMEERLASEIIAASKNEGGAAKKKDDTHRMAEANKAFAHYRW
ncbi:MAG: 30S ribosomal protein S7 [Candidatus Eiseniibacteriota bacterium]|nr:MAG: 30S ribosomal protein S7 [Candidatus Eisenbacteria bacterium]